MLLQDDDDDDDSVVDDDGKERSMMKNNKNNNSSSYFFCNLFGRRYNNQPAATTTHQSTRSDRQRIRCDYRSPMCFKQLQQRVDGREVTSATTNIHNNNDTAAATEHERLQSSITPVPLQIEANANGSSPPPSASSFNDFDLLALQNRPPWWNVELGSFVLNLAAGYRSHLSRTSQNSPGEANILLQFGRIQGRHVYHGLSTSPFGGASIFRCYFLAAIQNICWIIGH
jgi:hypothetical protein